MGRGGPTAGRPRPRMPMNRFAAAPVNMFIGDNQPTKNEPPQAKPNRPPEANPSPNLLPPKASEDGVFGNT